MTLPVATIKILTLDDRPPNNIFLKQLSAIAGVYPEIHFGDELGSEKTDLTEFNLVSLNAAAAVSLVGSRTADPWTLSPLHFSPDALIHFAFPRAQPTIYGEAELTKYREIMGSLDKPDVQRDIVDFLKGREISTGNEYLDTYATHLLGWLDYLRRSEINPDKLLITLDDNRPGPLADTIKIELGKYSNYVMDGTDEGMMLLLARYLREHQPDAPPTMGLIWTAPGDLMNIAPMESGFVADNLLSELRWLKVRGTSRLDLLESWRPILWVAGAGSDDEARRPLIEKAMSDIGPMPVIVADIATLNYGDPVLMDVWHQQKPPDGLVGYLGWNTSTNTLGSAVALWMAMDYGYAVRPDPVNVRSASEVFLWSRLLDDWLYQSEVRRKVSGEFIDRGINTWKMSDADSAQAASEIAVKLVAAWQEMDVDFSIPLRIVDPFGESGFTVELPWDRFFEIEILPNDYRGWVPTIQPVTGEGLN